ncbi:ferritin family protein, partial [Mesotoga prima]
KLEKDGEAYYTKQAQCSEDIQLKKLFEMLANDEQRHYEIISGFKDKNYNYKGTYTFKTTRNMFSEMLNDKKCFEIDATNLEAYEHAVEMEKESVKLYLDQAKQTSEPSEKEILLKLAAEENKHQIILENLMDFVRKGLDWTESPEFSHLEEWDKFTDLDKY